MRKHRKTSLLLLSCAIPLAIGGCGVRYSVHKHGYHRPPPPPPKFKHHHGDGYHHGHEPSCGCRVCR